MDPRFDLLGREIEGRIEGQAGAASFVGLFDRVLDEKVRHSSAILHMVAQFVEDRLFELLVHVELRVTLGEFAKGPVVEMDRRPQRLVRRLKGAVGALAEGERTLQDRMRPALAVDDQDVDVVAELLGNRAEEGGGALLELLEGRNRPGHGATIALSLPQAEPSVPELHLDPRLKVLIEADRIRDEVRRLAARIEEDYRGKPLTVLGVLKGSVLFLADLVRAIRIPMRLEFLRASSYGDSTRSSGTVELGPLEGAIRGRDVLVVDDILDSGRTLDAIRRAVREAGARSVKTCVLLDKQVARAVPVEADYAAFRIPPVFVVGYGLDYAEQFRNLPFLATFDENGAREGENRENGG